MSLVTDKQLLILLAVGGVALFYLKGKAVEVAMDVGNAVDPLNDDNIFNRFAVRLTQKLTGDPHATPGTWLYDKLHPDPLNQGGG